MSSGTAKRQIMRAFQRSVIASKWAEAQRLRPLLSRKPCRQDVPALQALLRQREAQAVQDPEDHNTIDEVTYLIRERLAFLHGETH